MNFLRILSTVLALASCTRSDVPLPAELVGPWVLSAESAKSFSDSCRTARLEFTQDGRLISQSGELILRAKISIERKNDGFILHQGEVEHYGKLNCQGKTAEFVVEHSDRNYFLKSNGIVLRQYFSTTESRDFIEYVRANT